MLTLARARDLVSLQLQCEHMFAFGSRHPPRRPRRVLRLGRAARRPRAARPAGDRRRRRGAGGELRGARPRRPHGDGRPPGAPALPRRDRGRAADVGVLRGQPRGVRRVRGAVAAGRGAVDRRGVPRRARAARRSRHAAADRRAVARARCASGSACRSPSASRGRSSSPRSRAASRSPTDCSCVPPDRELEFLHPLPVERAVGRRAVTAEKLHRRGITRSARSRRSRRRR